MALAAETPALIVCDAQNDFIEDDGRFMKSRAQAYRPEEKARFYQACRTLIDAYRAGGSPVIYACTELRADGLDAALSAKALGHRASGPFPVAGTWGARIVEPLAPRVE